MSYTNTVEWKNIRSKVIKRDGGRCKMCNSCENLQVHHRVYVDSSIVGVDDINDLTLLCGSCHTYFHNLQRNNKVNKQNMVAKYKGKKERSTFKPSSFPERLDQRLDFAINEYIDIGSIKTKKQYREKVEVLKRAILLDVL